jgi:hypothetical protein
VFACRLLSTGFERHARTRGAGALLAGHGRLTVAAGCICLLGGPRAAALTSLAFFAGLLAIERLLRAERGRQTRMARRASPWPCASFQCRTARGRWRHPAPGSPFAAAASAPAAVAGRCYRARRCRCDTARASHARAICMQPACRTPPSLNAAPAAATELHQRTLAHARALVCAAHDCDARSCMCRTRMRSRRTRARNPSGTLCLNGPLR